MKNTEQADWVLRQWPDELAAGCKKITYFGGLIDQTASLDPVMAVLAIVMSMLGTTLAARVLEKMTDTQFRLWANRVITTIAGYYVVQGGYLLVVAKTGLSLGF